MTTTGRPSVAAAWQEARWSQQRLTAWLVEQAYPQWSQAGVDPERGAFWEAIDQTGAPLSLPRRARVQARQAYAFAQAPQFGWQGDAHGIVARGLERFIADYRRADGLFRTLVAADGRPLDDAAHLYDQAFALLALAAAARLAGSDCVWERRANELLEALVRHLKRPGPGFDSGIEQREPLQSNAHMHLLEACLEWSRSSADPRWRRWSNEIACLALTRFVDPARGVLHERFDADWRPLQTTEGRLVEPGHHFEWAWLLLTWASANWAAEWREQATSVAERLIAIGESAGVRAGVAVDFIWDDLNMHDAGARLWPQTERLKAAALGAQLTGSSDYWTAAAAAARALERYLRTRTPGLWRDRLSASGEFLVGPAPAGNFYHVVAAILALTQACNHTTAVVPAADCAT